MVLLVRCCLLSVIRLVAMSRRGLFGVHTDVIVCHNCFHAGIKHRLVTYPSELLSAGGVTAMRDFQRKFFPGVLATEDALAAAVVTDPVQAAYCKYNDQVLQLVVSSLYISALFSGIIASKFAKLYGRKVQASILMAMWSWMYPHFKICMVNVQQLHCSIAYYSMSCCSKMHRPTRMLRCLSYVYFNMHSNLCITCIVNLTMLTKC